MPRHGTAWARIWLGAAVAGLVCAVVAVQMLPLPLAASGAGPGAPTVTGLSPNTGGVSGGTQVTITGANFAAGSTVSFGSAAVGAVTFNSPTSLTVASPPGTGTGSVDVIVTTPQGPSATSPADRFTYGPFDHIFTILMENNDYGSIVGSSSAPYINGLATQWGLATNYFALSHPSLPNYLALIGGDTFGDPNDCPPSSCPQNAPNLAVDRLDPAGLSWKAYMESMPGACDPTDSGQYAVRHNPFVYFDDLRNNKSACASKVVPYTDLAPDLAAASSTPNYAWITPNLCNDMHDCSISTGDTWLSQNVPAILNSPAFTQQRSLLMITWDEDATANNHVATLVVAPTVHPGTTSSVHYDHYSMLKTVEAAWGLAPLTANDAGASPMNDFFGPPVVPTPTPTPTPTPSPTPTPTPTPTPSPTPTPTPTPMPSPTPSPLPTPTPRPTPTPTPSPTPTPPPAPLPTVSSISPTGGSTAGGTTVTINGSGFAPGATVTFGPAGATNVSVVSGSQITASSPPSGPGTVDVRVTTPGGTSATSASDRFAYSAPPAHVPVVSVVNPDTGPVAGGTTVVVSGSDLGGATRVSFGAAAATIVGTSPGSVTVASPASATAGVVNVTVTTPGGTSATSASDLFTYTAPPPSPSVTEVSPINGPSDGSNTVTVTGANFGPGDMVRFGSSMGTNVVVVSPTQLTVTAPAGPTAGANAASLTVDVTVAAGASTSSTGVGDEYTYGFASRGYGITLSASTTSPAVGSPVTLTGRGNQNIGPTPWYMEIWDATTGVQLIDVPSGTRFSVTASQSQASTHRYIAVVGDVGGALVQAVSAPVVVTWGTPPPPPTVSSVSPTSGPVTGGTTVAVNGTGFEAGAAASFGAAGATVLSVTGTSMTVVSPPTTAVGTVDVQVTTSGGTSATSAGDRFTYNPPAPVISVVNPNTGPVSGGTTVVVSGSDLGGATQVSFGAAAATIVGASPGSLTVLSPASASAGIVDITVTTPGGTSAAGANDRFTYTAPPPSPSVSAVSPTNGPSDGSNTVTVTGANFGPGDMVRFGSSMATNVVVVSPTQLTVTAPAGPTVGANAASLTVEVTVAAGAATSSTGVGDEYTYGFASGGYGVSLSASTTSPTVGSPVTLTGRGNQNIGPTPWGMEIWDATAGVELIDVPSGTTFSVKATQTRATTHRYVAVVCDIGGGLVQAVSAPVAVAWGSPPPPPTVSSVSPTSGPASGGTAVTVNGTGFVAGASVSFGSVGASAVTVTSGTQITALSPPAGAGTVDVRVTTPGGTSGTNSTDRFTYTAPPPTAPSVSLVNPNIGPVAGGTTVIVSGSNLGGATQVNFGAVGGTIVGTSPGSITVVSPAATAAGAVDVTVVASGLTSAVNPNDRFMYTATAPPVPTVSSISPTGGPVAGGTTVTINGTGFVAGATVGFGSLPAGGVNVVSGKQITAVSPASPAGGTVDVRVTTPGGTSAVGTADRFTYAASGTGPSGVPMPTGNVPGWKQVFADDFTGNSLNTSAWGAYRGQPGGDSGGWWDPSHVVVQNGEMVLKSYVDPAHANPSNRNGYVSGGVSSAPALSQTYGKYLVRFRIDAGTGIGGILLLWPSTGGWPPEIDFSEDAGEDPGGARTHTSATLHCGSNNNDNCQVQNTMSGIDLTQWHTIGVEWTATSLKYTFDGTVWATATPSQASGNGGHWPTGPMEFDAQTQAGDCSHFTPCPNAATPPEVDMDLDWVVAYAPAP